MAIVQKKVCLLGASGVGKTSIVRRFVYGFFNDGNRLEALAAQFKAPYYFTSAKTDEKVEVAFRHLGQLLVR